MQTSEESVCDSGWAMLMGGLLSVFLAVCLMLFAGCEGDSEKSPITVYPPMASLQTGQFADFTASGGSDYQWSLKFEDTGTLSTRSGPTVRFTSTVAGTMPTIQQVLTVAGKVPSAAGSAGVAFFDVHIAQTPVGGSEVAPTDRTHVTDTAPSGHYTYTTNMTVYTNFFGVFTNITVSSNWVVAMQYKYQFQPDPK